MKWRSAIHQMVLAGVDSIPIVALISLFIGIVLALQGAYQLAKFGATYFVTALVGVSMTRELGPLMTAIIIAGRSGSAFAAELGTMKVSEEIDALEAMGLDSVRYLVVPKYLAMLIMMPCLTLIADLSGILGGAIFEMLQLDKSFHDHAHRQPRRPGDARHHHGPDQEPGVRPDHHQHRMQRRLFGRGRRGGRGQGHNLVGGGFDFSDDFCGRDFYGDLLLHE